MRGLAFPPNQDADRETSYEFGTPFSNVDDIPIDPALVETPIDPALMMESPIVNVEQPYQPENQEPLEQLKQTHVDDYDLFQYSGAAQGEEFTQHIPAPYFEIPQEQHLPPPKPKRKRKVRRDELCSFCQGSSSSNSRDVPEILLTCHECGRSGHPSCMQLERLSDVVRAYPWKCIECKNCEVCQEKGDDARILFCDACDRGWHLDCMDPPLDEPPEGEWHCPECPLVVPDDMEVQEDQEDAQGEEDEELADAVDPVREASVASSSRSIHIRQPQKGKKKGGGRGGKAKGRARQVNLVVQSEEEEQEDVDIEVDETPTVPARRGGRQRKSVATPIATTSTANRRRSTARARQPPSSDEEVQEDDGEIITATPVRSTKRRRTAVMRESSPPAPPLPRVRLRLSSRNAKGKEREDDEPRGLFDDILSTDERDTSKTSVLHSDKLHFERSRLAAEAKLAPPPKPPSPAHDDFDDGEDFGSFRPRHLRSSTIQQSTPSLLKLRVDLSNSPGPSTPGGSSLPSALPKFEPGVLRIKSIRFGPYEIKTWYDAPFPEEYATIPDGRLWICEFCLKYMKSRFGATRHQMKCQARHPPGDEIYRDGVVSIFEVDGRRNKIYCQNLCLLSKMFLDHKSLFYDVEPFLFYVITQVDEHGARFVGYFSKEKRCPKDYNLSCIMTLPVRQRQGWGNLLIDFSYLLSKIEQRLGSPEKPLSSLGALGYRNYWTLAVMRYLQTAPDNVRLEDICAATSMTMEDVFSTLTQQGMIYVGESSPPPMRPSPGQTIKFPRGRKNGYTRKHLQKAQVAHMPERDDAHGGDKKPFIPPRRYETRFDRDKVDEYIRNWEAKRYMKLKPEKLQWTPYLTSRVPQEANLPLLPVMDTVPSADGSGAGSIRGASETQPTTPAVVLPPEFGDFMDAPAVNGILESQKEEDELPMVIDEATPEAKRGRRRGPLKAKDPPPTTRSTRSQGVLSPVATPLTHGRGLRTRTAPLPFDEPISTRSARRNGVTPTAPSIGVNLGRKPPTRRLNKTINELTTDEAYAARLAMEELQQGGRQLRSRRSESQLENKRPVAMPLTPSKSVRSSQSRKRRRIDSSPDGMDDVDAVVVVRPPAEPMPVEVERKEEDGEEGGDDDADGEEEDEDEEPAAMDVDQVNGDPNDRVLETQTPEHADATTLVDANNASEETAVVKEILDVKYEDAGTPLTNLTSRQSVPSDDTVYMSGAGGVYQGPMHAESDIRSTLDDLDDCHDEDADGEYDEDAEGEPDPDVQ